ncbi:MAG TPA: hypothetical protein VMV22_06790 [Acidimicrobiales bacterium]|nr:hypothetical protein [Acidimicrobiales bacterium]
MVPAPQVDDLPVFASGGVDPEAEAEEPASENRRHATRLALDQGRPRRPPPDHLPAVADPPENPLFRSSR